MNFETVEELAEHLADRLELYGKDRTTFVSDYGRRIRESVQNEKNIEILEDQKDRCAYHNRKNCGRCRSEQLAIDASIGFSNHRSQYGNYISPFIGNTNVCAFGICEKETCPLPIPDNCQKETYSCSCEGVKIGTYENQIDLAAPGWSRHAYIGIDRCIADEILHLWSLGIVTHGCCCGHGKMPSMVNVDETSIDKMLSMGYVQNHPDKSRKDTFRLKSAG